MRCRVLVQVSDTGERRGRSQKSLLYCSRIRGSPSKGKERLYDVPSFQRDSNRSGRRFSLDVTYVQRSTGLLIQDLNAEINGWELVIE